MQKDTTASVTFPSLTSKDVLTDQPKWSLGVQGHGAPGVEGKLVSSFHRFTAPFGVVSY